MAQTLTPPTKVEEAHIQETERDFHYRTRYGPLTKRLITYKAERARGIVHTHTWDLLMEREEKELNAWLEQGRRDKDDTTHATTPTTTT